MSGPPVKQLGDTPARAGDDTERALRVLHARQAARAPSTRTSPSTRSRRSTATWTAAGSSASRTGAGCGTTTRRCCAARTGTTFRDPGEIWERPYYQQGAAAERADRAAPCSRRRARAAASTTSTPRGSSSCAPTSRCRRSSSTGCGSPRRPSRRDCLSDTITHAVVLQAAVKQRVGAVARPVRDGSRAALRRAAGRARPSSGGSSTRRGSPRARSSSACTRPRTGAR